MIKLYFDYRKFRANAKSSYPTMWAHNHGARVYTTTSKIKTKFHPTGHTYWKTRQKRGSVYICDADSIIVHTFVTARPAPLTKAELLVIEQERVQEAQK